MQESIERRKRGELTPDEVERIIKAKEKYDNSICIAPMTLIIPFLIPGQSCQCMILCEENVVISLIEDFSSSSLKKTLKQYRCTAYFEELKNSCPLKDFKDLTGKTGCQEKIYLTELETDTQMRDEIARRKEKRNKKEMSL